MKSYKKPIGDYGENLTCEYLTKISHYILDTKFRCKNGEIDIVSLINETLVFTEVKSRYDNKYGLPLESVDYRKQNAIKKVANYYIYINKLYSYFVRFDVCEIYLNHLDNSYKINYLENAFQ